MPATKGFVAAAAACLRVGRDGGTPSKGKQRRQPLLVGLHGFGELPDGKLTGFALGRVGSVGDVEEDRDATGA